MVGTRRLPVVSIPRVIAMLDATGLIIPRPTVTSHSDLPRVEKGLDQVLLVRGLETDRARQMEIDRLLASGCIGPGVPMESRCLSIDLERIDRLCCDGPRVLRSPARCRDQEANQGDERYSLDAQGVSPEADRRGKWRGFWHIPNLVGKLWRAALCTDSIRLEVG